MPSQPLTYLLKIDGVKGDSIVDGYEGYFTVDEFTFTELTSLAAATGGAGAGKSLARFDPLMVAIAGLPPGLIDLFKDAASGKHIASIDLVGLEQSGEGYLKRYDLTLSNVTVAGYAADGQHDTAIGFDFTALKETIASQTMDGSLGKGSSFSFDLARQGGAINPVNHGALAALAHDHSGEKLTYLLKVDGVKGNSTIKGYEGYFTVDEYTFNQLTKTTVASGSGAGAGKSAVQFDPLVVDIAGLPPGLIDLFRDAATGKHIASIDLVGLKQSGGGYQKISDLTLDNVTVAGYAADGQHDTAVAFDFTAFRQTITSQKPDGALGAGSSFSFDLARQGGAINPVNHDALTAFAHDHSGETLTYLLKVDGVKGDSTIKGYEGYFTVDEFTFNELTKTTVATGGGAGAGKSAVQFDPLTVDIARLSPGLIDLFRDTATGKHIASIDLVGLKQSGGGYQKISDLTLDNVTVAGYAADGQHDTAVAFDFTAFRQTITSQKPNGAPGADSSFSFDLPRQGGTIAPVNHDALTAFAHDHSGETLTYLLKVDGVMGDSTIKGYEGCFTVDEFTFNALTTITAATGGAGAGSGRATFDPLTVDIARLSPGLIDLFRDAATGKHIASIDLIGLKQSGDGFHKVSELALINVTVAGYAADGQHDTAIAFDFTAFKEAITSQNPDGAPGAGNAFSFDLARQGGTIAPVNHDALTAFAHGHSGEELTYLLKVDGVTGDSSIKGYEGYFTVDEFTFNALAKATAAAGGAGAGKGLATFDPLTVDIAGLSPGLVDLFRDAATGKHIASIDLVGLKHSGDGFQKVSDLTLDNVTIAGYAADGQHDTAIAFNFTALKETIAGQNPDGSLNAGHSFSFDLARQGGSINPVDHDALAAFADAHAADQLTYLLKISGANGDSTLRGYEGYFTVDQYTFGEFTKFTAGSGAGGGAGRTLAQFDPLTVDIDGLPPGLIDLLRDSATGRHIASIELVGLRHSGDGFQKVSDLTLNNVTIAGYAADGQHDTAIAFNFTALKETIAGQNPDGSLNAGHSFSFDLARQGGSMLPVDHDHLVAFAHAHSDFFMI